MIRWSSLMLVLCILGASAFTQSVPTTFAEAPVAPEGEHPERNSAGAGAITIRSASITAGGVKSSGGAFSASSTSGQPVVGAMSGGGFTMTGGFSPAPTIVLPPGALADPSGIVKTRFISFSIPAATVGNAGETAIRIWLSVLHHVNPLYTGGPSVPFTSFEGQVRWVGPPTQYVESSSSGVPFFTSPLQCAPHYQDWSTVGLLHVTGSAITPSSIYEVENVAASCAGIEATCTTVSAPLTIATTRWGDVRSPYNPPDGSVQPDISDVSALVDKFRNAPGAPIKARGILAGAPGNTFGEVTHDVLNVDFGFSHISACVDAFRGVPYPYTISACP